MSSQAGRVKKFFITSSSPSGDGPSGVCGPVVGQGERHVRHYDIFAVRNDRPRCVMKDRGRNGAEEGVPRVVWFGPSAEQVRILLSVGG